MKKENSILLPGSEKNGLYVHVPFCVSKCPYCAFHSVPRIDAIPDFIDTLEREIGLRADASLEADSVQLGGGTPSLLDPDSVGRILEALSRAFDLDPGAEITLEANPGTVTPEALRGFRRVGVNRLVLGAQSFSADDLAFLGRAHGPGEIVASYEDAREAGFENLGLDLIYGCPGRDETHWEAQMGRALELEPEHLSCYALTIEPDTPFGRARDAGDLVPPGEEESRAFFLKTHRFLASAGFPFYEVSNFSRAGRHPSRHNSKYWTLAPYVGFGPSAHSFRPPERRWNAPTLDAYLGSDDEALASGAGRESLRPSQMALELLSLGLRTARGVDLGRLEDLFAPDFSKANRSALKRLCEEGLTRRDGAFLHPTLEGLVVADRLPLAFDI